MYGNLFRLAVGLASVLALSGCAKGGAFVGTWTYGSGSAATIDCGGGANNDTLVGNVTIIGGSTSDIVLAQPSGCNLNFSVSGTTATLVPNQSCSISLAGTTSTCTGTLAFSTASLTLAGDNKIMTVQAHANATFSNCTGSCTYTQNASLTRVGN
jgi:hypothetical protein